MKARYEMTRFDADSYPGTAIVRIQATALHTDGSPATYRKRVSLMENGKPAVGYEQASVFSEAERRLPYEGQEPQAYGLEVARSVKGELDDKLAKALNAHGLRDAAPAAPKIEGPVELKL